MIVILGETAAAHQMSDYLKTTKIKFKQYKTWSKKNSLISPTAIFDVGHPSSNNQFAMARQWCEQEGIPYIKLERPETNVPTSTLIFPTYSWEEALAKLEERVKVLNQEKERQVTVFVTTGSHQLDSIVHSPFADLARLVVRVLPEGKLVQKCQNLGIPTKDIIAMQGPFSKEINKALFKFYGADILLTRDSGLQGGTNTKISAALQLGLEVILIKKGQMTSGITVNSMDEIIAWINRLESIQVEVKRNPNEEE